MKFVGLVQYITMAQQKLGFFRQRDFYHLQKIEQSSILPGWIQAHAKQRSSGRLILMQKTKYRGGSYLMKHHKLIFCRHYNFLPQLSEKSS
jgi:hypothetical protein